jgi:hypothetical protein
MAGSAYGHLERRMEVPCFCKGRVDLFMAIEANTVYRTVQEILFR